MFANPYTMLALIGNSSVLLDSHTTVCTTFFCCTTHMETYTLRKLVFPLKYYISPPPPLSSHVSSCKLIGRPLKGQKQTGSKFKLIEPCMEWLDRTPDLCTSLRAALQLTARYRSPYNRRWRILLLGVCVWAALVEVAAAARLLSGSEWRIATRITHNVSGLKLCKWMNVR